MPPRRRRVPRRRRSADAHPDCAVTVSTEADLSLSPDPELATLLQHVKQILGDHVAWTAMAVAYDDSVWASEDGLERWLVVFRDALVARFRQVLRPH